MTTIPHMPVLGWSCDSVWAASSRGWTLERVMYGQEAKTLSGEKQFKNHPRPRTNFGQKAPFSSQSCSSSRSLSLHIFEMEYDSHEEGSGKYDDDDRMKMTTKVSRYICLLWTDDDDVNDGDEDDDDNGGPVCVYYEQMMYHGLRKKLPLDSRHCMYKMAMVMRRTNTPDSWIQSLWVIIVGLTVIDAGISKHHLLETIAHSLTHSTG